MQPSHARATRRLAQRRFRRNALSVAVTAAVAALTLAACGSDDPPPPNTGTPPSPTQNPNNRPTFIVGTIGVQTYDGNSDDLATGGLGKDGIGGTAPAFADPNNPTPAELRRNAIFTNYRAIVDINPAGGYGTLYGPNVDAQGNVTSGQGKVAGVEYIAFSDDGSGRQNVTLMAQIPDSFDRNNPCIITATSSGSRGIYGGIAVGEWGLKRGCAVAYTDKGTGAAPHDLDSDTVPLINGTRQGRAGAGKLAQFAAQPGSQSLADFTAAYPHRQAFKHAHSQQNPEANWGRNTLQAIEFTLFAINDKYGTMGADGVRQATFTPSNVLVIASAVSNGGGAAIAAAEQDTTGLIDGVAVGEPMLEIPPTPAITVRRGGTPVAASGKSLYDYTTTANLFQLCARQDVNLTNAPSAGALPQATNRCQSLAAKSLVTGGNTNDQSAAALAALRSAGWEAESDELHASLSALEVASSISVTYANAYARASVTDRFCNYSFAVTGVDFKPLAIPAATLAQFFSTGNGVPPSGIVTLVNDANPLPTGPIKDFASVSPSTGIQDANLDGALCLRNALTGNATVQASIAETYRSGNLRGKPTVIVHGRNDALLPVNHTSRPYLGLNRSVEGSASKLSYIEVTNAQHFDGFIDVLPGYAARYIPLHLYLNRALDAVWANLRSGTALPPSQVVRTTARGGSSSVAVGPQILPANVPPMLATPAAGDVISASSSTVDVPN